MLDHRYKLVSIYKDASVQRIAHINAYGNLYANLTLSSLNPVQGGLRPNCHMGLDLLFVFIHVFTCKHHLRCTPKS